MRVLLDQTECPVQADSVGQAIDACAEIAETRGRRIVEVVVDGRVLSSTDLDSKQCMDRRAGEVHLLTADPASLVAEALAEAGEVLAEAETLQREAAEMLQAGQRAEGLEALNETCSIWLSVQQTLMQGSDLLGIRLDQCVVSGRTAAQIIEDLGGILRRIKEHLENDDLAAVADAALYELPDAAVQWRALIAQMRDEMRDRIR